MALCDYRLCDNCGGKTFYDASLNYEWTVGEEQPRLDNLGDWSVLCDECAKTKKCIVVDRDADTADRTPDPPTRDALLALARRADDAAAYAARHGRVTEIALDERDCRLIASACELMAAIMTTRYEAVKR